MKNLPDTIKPGIPTFIKPITKQGVKAYRAAIDRMRLVPSFIVIGGQRCGTTSLYNYLIQHPCIAPASKKEIHFFDYNYSKGLIWYKRHFPSLIDHYRAKFMHRQDLMTGEATPNYIFYPHAARRILQSLPRVKIIIMLRNPIERAYSHYLHHRRFKVETLSFEEAIEIEEKRLEGEIENMISDEHYYSYKYQMYSYLTRGIYIDQLKNVMNSFPNEQIMIIKSEEFFQYPSNIFKRILDFLNLPKFELREYGKYNASGSESMHHRTRERLIDYFLPRNQLLYEYLNMHFDWDK